MDPSDSALIFRRLNARTKKDSYPLPRIQEALESMAGAAHFSSMDFKSGFWQVRMALESQQYTCLHGRQPGFLRIHKDAFWAMQHTRDIPASDAKYTGRVELDLLHHLSGRCDSIWSYGGRTPRKAQNSIGALPRI